MRKMALGILSRATRPLRGLGAYTSKIPAECWGQPGFGDCHTKAYAQAQTECANNGLRDDEGCIGAAADSISMSNCACKRGIAPKPVPKPKPVVTNSSVSPDASLVEPETMVFGMPGKTVAMIALGAVGIFLFTQQKKGPKS
jgi:hypothetical protein